MFSDAHRLSSFLKIFLFLLTLGGCAPSKTAWLSGNPFENPFNARVENNASAARPRARARDVKKVTIRTLERKKARAANARAAREQDRARRFAQENASASSNKKNFERPLTKSLRTPKRDAQRRDAQKRQRTVVMRSTHPATNLAAQNNRNITSPNVIPPNVAPSRKNRPQAFPQKVPPRNALRQNLSDEAQRKNLRKKTSPLPTSPLSKAKTRRQKLTFRWPVRGRVILAYGAKNLRGVKNTGINIAVPEGTRVKAAADGHVVYVGDEANDYGKIILVKHQNGYISAYAHNRDIIVRQGETVTRGQVIAYAGQTGSVSRPQVHFEIRKGVRPVDPINHLQ